MKAVSLTLAVLAMAASRLPAATEQEMIEALTADLKEAMSMAQRAAVLQSFELESAFRLAGEERELMLLFARKQLAADVAAASADLAASTEAPAEARRRYYEALSQALNDFRQGINQVQNDLSEGWSRAYNQVQRTSSNTFQEIYQAISNAQQKHLNDLMRGDNAEMPPVIEPGLPDLTPQEGEAAQIVATLKQAVEEAHSRYQADIEAAEAACDQALGAAMGLQADAMQEAMDQAIAQLRLTCLDRHDQYGMEIRSASRRALLGVEE